MAFNQGCRGLEAIAELDVRYFRYQLSAMTDRLSAHGQGSTFVELSSDALSSVVVCAPDISAQRAIADFLDTETARIDALIAKKRRLVELLEERFLSFVHRLVTGADHPAIKRRSGIEWIGDIPSTWGLPWVGANFTNVLGKMLNTDAVTGSDQYPYLRNTNVKWDEFDLSDLAMMSFSPAERIRCELRSGDLLVCEGGEVGRSAVWSGSPPNVYFQKAIHRVRPIGDASTRFLMYCLRAAAAMNVFSAEGNQSTIVHLTGEKLREHRFPFPPVGEQVSIVEQLDAEAQSKNRSVDAIGRQISLLQERRQALITAAVTGELPIPEVAA